MPELPEVETVRGELEAVLVGRTISKARVFEARLRKKIPNDLTSRLHDLRITGVKRRAKFLVIETTGPSLLSHLGMTGAWRLEPGAWKKRKHDHLALCFGDGASAVFADPRRFGLFTYVDARSFAGLGPEPLDAVFDGAFLREAFAGRRAPVKTLIMDQRIVVGVGNIYAAEALFRAGISPRRQAGRLTLERTSKLVRAIKEVLGEALAAGGSTTSDYRRVNGDSGRFQNSHRVYARAGLACVLCTTPIRSLRQGGRSTFYCPKCQK
jgi:formamidopyrimidine-DNA glycosylase